MMNSRNGAKMVKSISTNPAFNADETYCKGDKMITREARLKMKKQQKPERQMMNNNKYILNNKQISNRLDAIGHTVLWLCDRMAISQQTYYNWIKTGTNKGRLMEMADALGCKPADLV